MAPFIREYAVKNGHKVVREFVDEAESSRTADRPAFLEMVKIAQRPQRPFDALLVWKYSRFTRSREDSIVYKTMLRRNGVRVISITEPFEDTPTGRLLEAMIESLDEFYSADLGQDIKCGLRESARRGFFSLVTKVKTTRELFLVEIGGFEPPTSAMRTQRSPD